MVKITAQVEGMKCGMCEKHVKEAVQKAFTVKSVDASKDKKQAEIVAAEALDEAKVKEVIEGAGYTVTGIKTEPYKKKGLFGF